MPFFSFKKKFNLNIKANAVTNTLKIIVKYITKRNNEVALCLMKINIHAHISNIHMYIYSNIIYFFESIVSKAWPSSSVFLIIPIIFHGVSIAWTSQLAKYILLSSFI